MLLFADDLTGGNDAGIQFAKVGFPTRLFLSAADVSTSDLHDSPGQVQALNVNTRNMSADSVRSILPPLVERCVLSDNSIVFKKIDSTMRGNFGVEIDLLMDGFGIDTAFLAPAYPAMARLVRDSKLFVNNTPLHLTAFAKDPIAPVRDSSILSIVRGQCTKEVVSISLSKLAEGPNAVARSIEELHTKEGQIFVFDTESDKQLDEVAEIALSMNPCPLLIGSAGLAAATAKIMGGKKVNSFHPRLVQNVFFICGSAHEATHTQIKLLAEAGIPVIRLPQNILADSQSRAETVEKTINALAQGSTVLATPLERLQGSDKAGLALSDLISTLALEILRQSSPRALVFAGGETAYAVLKQICRWLNLHTELLAGIPLCSIGDGQWRGLPVATKAGGFGAPDALVKVLSMLQGKARIDL